MKNNALLFGITGFILGGLVVSIAATTFDKPDAKVSHNSDMSMSIMTALLADKKGEDFDAAFIQEMTAHHESAVAMAKLAATQAKHDEIKTLSTNIISAQQTEISQMKQWQTNWNYGASSQMPAMHSMH